MSMAKPAVVVIVYPYLAPACALLRFPVFMFQVWSRTAYSTSRSK